MTTEAPDVTVVIPTRGRPEMLAEALESCRASSGALELEIIVVIDGNSPRARRVLRNRPANGLRYVQQEHRGAPAARNRGLRLARGDYVKFLDDDDLLRSRSLEAEVEALRAQEADLSAGWLHVDGGAAHREGVAPPRPPDPLVDLLARRCTTHPHRFTVRRSLARRVRWDEALPCVQDFQYFLEVAARAEGYVSVDRTVGRRRIHAGLRLSSRGREGVGNRLRLEILLAFAQRLRDRTFPSSPARLRALREGIWSELHILAGTGWPDLARRSWSMIDTLSEGRFVPPRQRSWLAALDEVLGARTVERGLVPFRRLKHHVARVAVRLRGTLP